MFRSTVVNSPPRTVHRLDLSGGLRRWGEGNCKNPISVLDVFSLPITLRVINI